MKISVRQIDYQNKQDGDDLLYLMDSYSIDPMGDNAPLDKLVKNKLVDSLSKIPHAFSVIAYVDNKPAGLTNCFECFSTFKAKPLINIHDLIVTEEFRGLKISFKMLETVEKIAKQRDCCKITLEVLEGNIIAQNAYQKFGFAAYELDPKMGKALFWQKNL